jgi:hypothetical protein
MWLKTHPILLLHGSSPVPDASGDEDDLGIESDRALASPEFSGDHASSGFTAPSALDDIELF